MMWAVDETRTDGLTLGYPYFETPEPFDLEEDGHLRRERPRVRQHPPAVLEPRHRRDPDRPARPAGSRSPGSSSTAACPGTPCPAGWCATATSTSGAWSTRRSGCRCRTRCRPASRSARSARPLGRWRAEPGEEALVVDDHALDGAAADDRAPGIRRLDLEAEPAARRRTPPPPRTVTCSPTALGARCSSRTDVPTLDDPGGSRPSRARQVAASHQASRRGVPSTGSPPEPSATAVSSSATTATMTPRSPTLTSTATTVCRAFTDAERAQGWSRYRGRPTERT